MDIHQILKNPKGVSRENLAFNVARAFSAGEFNGNEIKIAIDIFHLLLRDAEKSIRKTLADSLCYSLNAPHDIILKLANDKTDVAERVLQYSMVLTDDDLLAIIKSTKDVLNWCAIARRRNVSEKVSNDLLSTRQEQVLGDLFTNKGAKLSKNGLEQVWDIVSQNDNLLEALVQHGDLPPVIAEKMLALVSDELKQHIEREYNLKSPTLQKHIADVREWQLLGLMPIEDIAYPDDDEKVEDLVDQLAARGHLTHSLIVRSLCMGCLNLFEAGMARMAEVPRVNARILLMGGDNGFTALYKTANMPEGFADAVQKLLNIALELSKYGHSKPEDFRKLVIERIYISGYHQKIDGMNYLLSIIDGNLSKMQNSQNIREAA
jgi:uncharacterized protein (DUF2336 family)